jgi:hypothetical protein
MAVLTSARLGKLRLGAGRLAYVAPRAPHTPTPPHQSLAGPLTVQWLGEGNGYDVYFGSFTNMPKVGTTQSRAWVLPPLIPGAVYYWQIYAKPNALGAGVFGPTWSFTATVPLAPISPSPPHHSTNQSPTLTLAWTQPVGAPGDIVYDVYFGTTPHPPLVQRRQTGTTYTPGTLKDGVDYYWRVVAINNVGAASGPVWTFETRNPTKGLITIGGVDVRARVRLAGMSVRDLLADTPNTASFTIEGTAPTVGQEVRIGLATLAGDDVLFGGYIDTVEALYEGRPENRAWRVTAQDYVYGINRRKVRVRYVQQSATTIAQSLLALAPTGYTGTHIAAGLPVVNGGIDFTEEDLTTCFARLAARIGGYWYVDYAKDVHLFLTESAAAPTPITRAARVLLDEPPIHWSTDLTQIRTRVYVEGGGSQARALVAVGATSLPVTDASWYSPTGGLVVSGPQRIRYTGKGTVGGPAKPTATGQSVVGALGGGPYSYVVTQIIAGAESPLSPPSAPVTLPAVASPPPTLQISASFSGVPAPISAPVVTPQLSGVSAPPTAPTVSWVSTLVSPPATGPRLTNASTVVTPPATQMGGTPALPMTGELASPGPPTNAVAVDGGTGTMHPGGTINRYWWSCTYTNAQGETLRGSERGMDTGTVSCNASVTVAPAPTGLGITGIKVYRTSNAAGGSTARLTTTLTANGGTFKDTTPAASLGQTPPTNNGTGTPGTGGLTPGSYYWRVTFVAAPGETTTGPSSSIAVSGTYTAVQLNGIPTSGDGRVTARKLYRSRDGSNFNLEATINDNHTTTYLSTVATVSGAAPPSSNTTGTGKLTSGATYYWAVTFATASGETTSGPGIGTQAADTVNLSQIPTSGDGRVTRRKIYRTTAGGSSYRLEATINDNTTTTYQSGGVPDGSLGAAMPGTNTSGTGGLVPGQWHAWIVTFVTGAGETPGGPALGGVQVPPNIDQAQLSSIPIGPAQVVARRLYRNSPDGWYKLVATINDNSTTTYLDSKTTAQLGASMPTENTTGGGGLLPGMSYQWLVTFVTNAGETTNGPGTAWITMPPDYDVATLAGLPISTDVRVTKRKLYRVSQSGDWQWRLEATINDNTSTTFTSTKTEGALGAAGLPPANTTGSGGLIPNGIYYWTVKYVTANGESGEHGGIGFQMPAGMDTAHLSAVPVSADGRVTKRRIYRTVTNTGTYRVEQDIADNVTTTATSTKADSALGADLVSGNTTSAGGQIAVSGIAIGGGTTTARKLYRTASGGAAYQLVTQINDNTTTTYQDNKSDGSLGALAPVDEVTELIGIPASGPGSVLYEIRMGDDVNIFVQCDDVPAQTALAAMEGAPSQGIVEHVLQDRRLAQAQALATGMADLKLFSRPIITIQYATRDPKTRSGKSVQINLPELSLVGDFTIQTVEIDEIDLHPGVYPQYRVTCSSVRFSFEDAVRRFQIEV